LAQALANVVENAIEAVGPRGGSVGVRVHRDVRTAFLDVEDDGPGLATPGAPIFDAFYSTKPRGTGLGLAIAHRIVTDHGGTVDVESKPGRTPFRFSLPAIDPEREGVT
jgi:signal transduction histidine kinase